MATALVYSPLPWQLALVYSSYTPKKHYILSNHFKTKVNIYVMVKSHDIKTGSIYLDNFQVFI